mgnify:CR=1 FL=1
MRYFSTLLLFVENTLMTLEPKIDLLFGLEGGGCTVFIQSKLANFFLNKKYLVATTK